MKTNSGNKTNKNDSEWYKALISSDGFWKYIERKDQENIKNGVYGKHIITNDKELEDLFK